jgi:putative PIG3 family NAD(P)H quinone oxidoreductase
VVVSLTTAGCPIRNHFQQAVASNVAALDGVTQVGVGERVFALMPWGAYAEQVVVDQSHAYALPDFMTFEEGAAFGLAYQTAWCGLVHRAALRPGETLLVHGGTSGIGTTAIQLARAFGARVFATAGSADKCAACLRLGAEAAIDYKNEDFVARIRELTAKRGVDVVLDIVGGDYVTRNLDALAIEGRLVQIAFLKSSKVEIDLMQVMRRRLTITGSTLRPRSPEEKGVIARQLAEHVWPLLESRTVRPVIHAEFPLDRAVDAHRMMEASQHIGKIVLTI